MKIAIDAGPLKSGHKVRGIGVHTRELLSAFHQVTKLPSYQDAKIEAVDFGRANLAKYDIIHYQYFNPFFITLPAFARASASQSPKVIVTIHDLIPLIYPEHYPPGSKGSVRFLKQKLLLRKVDAIITISETSKKDICRFLGIHPDKVYVIPLAPRRIFKPITNRRSLITTKQKYRLPDRFVLYVGDINYNKNIPALVEACKFAKVPLVICGKQAREIEDKGIDIYSLKGPRDWARFLFGKPHPEIAHYQEVLDKVKGYKDVFRLGFIPDSDLVAIYNLATVYVQASFYEGFSLPILEAQASGCPVIVSQIQVHKEITEDSVLFADPKNPGDFAKKIKKVLTDKALKEKLITKGLENVKNYSWQRTAKSTIEVYKSLE